jgi:predicted amidophosphoribosyltransferase
MRAVEVVALRLKEMAARSEFGFLADYFGANSVVVPIPRSAPLKDPTALWPSRELCKAIVAQGLACEMLPLLERVQAVPKSAFAKSAAERATPDQHFQSTSVKAALQLFRGRTLVLVDDVITRGSTMLGMHTRLKEAFPDVDVKCFAAFRSMGHTEIEGVYEPVQGSVSFVNCQLRREP